jgi:orotidine-5'-phosphate decarboxylase
MLSEPASSASSASFAASSSASPDGSGNDSLSHARERLIVALDCSGTRALELARELSGSVAWVKVGMELFYSEGAPIVTSLKDLGLKVFLDLKLHDIPNTVRNAARVLSSLGADMLTVHASGGDAMVAAAREGLAEGSQAAGVLPPKLLAVTVLTSIDQDALERIGIDRPVADQARLLARLASGAGADGIVCSPQEADLMSRTLPAGSLIVTPGVRPKGSAAQDQSRIATPKEAVSHGATHLVVGRPITQASDPLAAARSIVAEIASCL